MKCPKCGYLGFENVDRCRNCGYEFALAAGAAFPEFPIREDNHTLNPLGDLSMVDAAAAAPPDVGFTDVSADLDRLETLETLETTFGMTAPEEAQRSPSRELPLFAPAVPDDEPLIKTPSPPRPPLAVRRSTPEVPRVRVEQPRLQSLDLREDAVESKTGSFAAAQERSTSHAESSMETAAIPTRIVAAAIDLIVLGVIDLIVIYFTMQICGVTVQELNILPKGPLLAFLLVQNGGYLVAFTAGGQTLGKMATGIRVVEAESDAAVDFGHAMLRTIIWLILAVPAGLGFLTLIGREHRGLHDRFAHTRVVRSPL